MPLSIGIIGTSLKENEHRVPVHPHHLNEIAAERRASLRFERDYGARFGVSDAAIEAAGASVASRDSLLAECDVVVLPKPTADDFSRVREGGVVWGWPHCVQQQEVTQIAIDRKLTLIAWEAMFEWSRSGTRGIHVFARNNELAGYCGVIHALQLTGIDGAYGPARSVVILGFGSVSRGAAFALRGRGFTELTLYTQRPPHLVSDRLFGARHRQMKRGRTPEEGLLGIDAKGQGQPLIEALSEADLIVNGTLQDTDAPLMFCRPGEEGQLTGSLIVDVSCDLGMGFPFARPTSFEAPTFSVSGATYYAVDHTPSYLWDAASWEISRALLPYLSTVMDGPDAWAGNETVRRAIEVQDGRVINPKILSFQRREEEYPHRVV